MEPFPATIRYAYQEPVLSITSMLPAAFVVNATHEPVQSGVTALSGKKCTVSPSTGLRLWKCRTSPVKVTKSPLSEGAVRIPRHA